MGTEEIIMRLAKIQRRQKPNSRDWKAIQLAINSVEANWMVEQLIGGMEEYWNETTKPFKFDDEQED